MHIFECFRDVLLLNVFAFSIAKLNGGICIPRLNMSLLSPLEYKVSMVTRKNKHEICLSFAKCLCTRPPCVPWELAGRMVWLQVSAQRINKSNICIRKLMRLVFLLVVLVPHTHFVTPPLTSLFKHNVVLGQNGNGAFWSKPKQENQSVYECRAERTATFLLFSLKILHMRLKSWMSEIRNEFYMLLLLTFYFCTVLYNIVYKIFAIICKKKKSILHWKKENTTSENS